MTCYKGPTFRPPQAIAIGICDKVAINRRFGEVPPQLNSTVCGRTIRVFAYQTAVLKVFE